MEVKVEVKKGLKLSGVGFRYALLLSTTSLREKGWAFSFDSMVLGRVMWPSLEGAGY